MNLVNTRLTCLHEAPRTACAGWFESSWDLRRGLEVSEAWAADEAAATQREEARAASFTAAPRSITAIA